MVRETTDCVMVLSASSVRFIVPVVVIASSSPEVQLQRANIAMAQDIADLLQYCIVVKNVGQFGSYISTMQIYNK